MRVSALQQREALARDPHGIPQRRRGFGASPKLRDAGGFGLLGLGRMHQPGEGEAGLGSRRCRSLARRGRAAPGSEQHLEHGHPSPGLSHPAKAESSAGGTAALGQPPASSCSPDPLPEPREDEGEEGAAPRGPPAGPGTRPGAVGTAQPQVQSGPAASEARGGAGTASALPTSRPTDPKVWLCRGQHRRSRPVLPQIAPRRGVEASLEAKGCMQRGASTVPRHCQLGDASRSLGPRTRLRI